MGDPTPARVARDDGTTPPRLARIANVAVAAPVTRIRQADAAEWIGIRLGEPRRARAIARRSGIEQRSIATSPDELLTLRTIEARNNRYHDLAAPMALTAVRRLGLPTLEGIGCLVTSSCTGYTIPSLAVELATGAPLPPEVVRVPITEAGCAGGLVAMLRAADHVVSHGAPSLAVAAEVCSLAFQEDAEEGNLTSTLLFGDGAGAAYLESGEGDGLTILDASSTLVPGTQGTLGFELTDRGFRPVLSRALPDLLAPATVEAVRKLLARRELEPSDIDAWLIHPGGARILEGLQRALCTPSTRLRWSWESLREQGNMSSASIFDVTRRYLEEARGGETALLAAFGPGLSIELALVRAQC